MGPGKACVGADTRQEKPPADIYSRYVTSRFLHVLQTFLTDMSRCDFDNYPIIMLFPTCVRDSLHLYSHWHITGELAAVADGALTGAVSAL